MTLPANVALVAVASQFADNNLNSSVVGSEAVSGTGTVVPSRNGGYARALFIGGAGTVTYTLASSSSTDSTVNLATGIWHPMAVTSIVITTGSGTATTTVTSATDIHFGY